MGHGLIARRRLEAYQGSRIEVESAPRRLARWLLKSRCVLGPRSVIAFHRGAAGEARLCGLRGRSARRHRSCTLGRVLAALTILTLPPDEAALKEPQCRQSGSI